MTVSRTYEELAIFLGGELKARLWRSAELYSYLSLADCRNRSICIYKPKSLLLNARVFHWLVLSFLEIRLRCDNNLSARRESHRKENTSTILAEHIAMPNHCDDYNREDSVDSWFHFFEPRDRASSISLN